MLKGRPLFRVATIAGASLIGLAAGPSASAFAYDWKIESVFSERIEHNDNVGLSAIEAQEAVGVSASGGVTVSAVAPTNRFVFDARMGYTLFNGIDDDYRSENVNNGYSLSYQRSSKDVVLELRGSLTEVSTFFSEVEDTGQIGSDSRRLGQSVDGSLSYRLNATDSASVSGGYSTTTFSAAVPGLGAFESWSVGTTFSRDVNRTLGASLSARANVFTPAAGPGSVRYTVTGSLDKQLSRTVGVNGSVGIRYVVRDDDRPDPADISLTSNTGSETIGIPINFSASYKGKDTALSLGLSRQVSGSASGSLQGSTSIRLGASYNVNQHLAATFSGSLSSFVSSGDDGSSSERTNFSLSPSLSYVLARDWSLNLGYLYKNQDSESGQADSNNVFLTLSHKYLPLP